LQLLVVAVKRCTNGNSPSNLRLPTYMPAAHAVHDRPTTAREQTLAGWFNCRLARTGAIADDQLERSGPGPGEQRSHTARYGMPFGHPVIKAILGSVGVGLLCGLLVYAAVRLAWPNIAAQEFTNIIGFAAVIGAGIAGAIARRRAAAESKQADDAQKK